MPSDIEIARQVKLKPVTEIASQLAIDAKDLQPYGHYKAKLPLSLIDHGNLSNSKLILVSAISPTPAGEGKTTMSIGLTQGMNRIGKQTTVVLREPSLGPVFGMKGGATGGGLSQVLPMEDINLHFTGDFAAVEKAHNLLSALIDNNLQSRTRSIGIDARTVAWKRVFDMNDRALRDIVVGLGGSSYGIPRETGFDITAASEIMAILCLTDDLPNLKQRLGNIFVGFTMDRKPVYARDLNASGAMAALLKDAIQPNLVQTIEGTPAIIHGGPFANIAQGTNTVIATRMGLSLSDYVVTEAGFGCDLGAEKFFDIKCAGAGLKPSVVVLVATVRALKYHGGGDLKELTEPNPERLPRALITLKNILKIWSISVSRRWSRLIDLPRIPTRKSQRLSRPARPKGCRRSWQMFGARVERVPKNWPRRWRNWLIMGKVIFARCMTGPCRLKTRSTKSVLRFTEPTGLITRPKHGRICVASKSLNWRVCRFALPRLKNHCPMTPS